MKERKDIRHKEKNKNSCCKSFLTHNYIKCKWMKISHQKEGLTTRQISEHLPSTDTALVLSQKCRYKRDRKNMGAETTK